MEPFVAQIQAFGFNFAPRGWAPCDGRLLPISQYTAVFSLLGTTYGGNGQTTFALPDLRGRSMINQGQGPGLSSYQIGQVGGTESTTLTSNQMPIHTHVAVATPHTHNATATPHTHVATATSTLYAEAAPATFPNPISRMLATTTGNNTYADPAPSANRAMYSDSIQTAVTNADTTDVVTNDQTTVTITNGNAGGSQPFDNRSPFLCVNVCIALEGIFPPRN